MIKVFFDSHHFLTPEIYLKSILKMTPGCKGIWKNIQAVLNPNDADYYIIMDGESQQWPIMEKKAIYFGQHPNTPYSPIDKIFEGKNGLLKFPLNKYLNFGEWWIDYNYDQLIAMKPPKKTKQLACIATYQDHHPMYIQRQNFLRELVTKQSSLNINLYGRPQEKYENDDILKPFYKGVLGNKNFNAIKGEHIIGKNVLIDYKYSLEFDVGPCTNYISERFYDAILLWCTPIYFGCTNISDFLPHQEKAYYIFDQHNLIHINRIKACIEGMNYYLEALNKVRDLLLNKYQTWAYVHHVVNNIKNYQVNPTKTFKEWIKL